MIIQKSFLYTDMGQIYQQLCKPPFSVKIVLSGFTKDAQWRISTEKAWTQLFCAWPYWICICRSFPFRHKLYGRRVLKWLFSNSGPWSQEHFLLLPMSKTVVLLNILWKKMIVFQNSLMHLFEVEIFSNIINAYWHFLSIVWKVS